MEDTTTEVKEEEKKQPPKGMKRTIGAIIGVIILCGVGYFVHDALMYQSTDDAYVETTTVQVSPKVSGHITKVYVDDNQHIEAGMVVAEIDDTDYKVALQKAEAAYEKVLLDQKNAQANFKAMQTNIEVAKKDLDRYTKLFESGAVSKQTLDTAQAKYDSAQANLTQAEQALLSKSDNKVADANLKVVKAELDQAKLNLQYTKVIAPQTGTVTSRRVEKGMFVQTGSPLFVIVPDKVWVVANFKENQLRNMKPHQKVDIKVDTYPNHIFKGEVQSIQRSSGAKSSLFPPENAVGSFVKIVQRIPVKIVFTEKINPDEFTIVPGMSVVPKVRVKE
ncbi:TPA: HlyD family secretion protein [Candidatus Scatousia excrementigallinarum]|uniref:HlyD family secretion protein n=1 Tax=Candidatus Scatousia excrementigallinarum TaxID=2840935 RepID=A0A9D1JMJ1_9BACT|nr:HlyD family secretion protein [Candidatus Scatousia excrementigallinarum]